MPRRRGGRRRHSKLLPVHRLSGLVAWFERHPTRSFVAIGLLFALAYVTAHVWFPKPPGRVIDGDALSYYAWLRSVIFDGDIDFSNDYRLLSDELAEDSWHLTPLATGLVSNPAPPGAAMLWAPLFLAVGAVVALLNLIGAQIPFDGLALPFKLSAGVAGIAYATAGVWLCYDLARRIYSAAARVLGDARHVARRLPALLLAGVANLLPCDVAVRSRAVHPHLVSNPRPGRPATVCPVGRAGWTRGIGPFTGPDHSRHPRTRIAGRNPETALVTGSRVRSTRDAVRLLCHGVIATAMGVADDLWDVGAESSRSGLLSVGGAGDSPDALLDAPGAHIVDPDSAVWGRRATLAVSARPAVGLDCGRHSATGAVRQRLSRPVVGQVQGSADAVSSAICRSSCSGCRPSLHPVRWRPVRRSCASPPSS